MRFNVIYDLNNQTRSKGWIPLPYINVNNALYYSMLHHFVLDLINQCGRLASLQLARDLIFISPSRKGFASKQKCVNYVLLE